MSVFHFFKVVQMVANRAKHHKIHMDSLKAPVVNYNFKHHFFSMEYPDKSLEKNEVDYRTKQAWSWVKCFACVNRTPKSICTVMVCDYRTQYWVQTRDKKYESDLVTEVAIDTCSGK